MCTFMDGGSMEKEFVKFLFMEGISSSSVSVLEKEEVMSFNVFSSLTENHTEQLFHKVKLGQHALLQKIWKQAWQA